MSRRHFIYIAVLLMTLLQGCTDKRQEQLNKWKVTVDPADKQPYGSYLAYESLKYYFPGIPVEQLTQGFRFTDLGNKVDKKHSLMILAGQDFFLSDKEWDELKTFITKGNYVIIFSSHLDSKIEDELNCYENGGGENTPILLGQNRHENRNAVWLADEPWKTYGYEGRTIRGYFEKKEDNEITAMQQIDSVRERPRMYVLGNTKDKPNFVRFNGGEGQLTLHSSPLVLSNYFLLQPGNEQYLSGLWATLPDDIAHVYWNDYFKRSSEASSLSVLWRYPSTRLAIQLAILVLLLYVLFEGKRKQRIIPVKEVLKNESVSFVETVGRLYYNKGNHANLANKISQQFLEYVRNNYFINTNQLNEQFIVLLTIKSGQPEAVVRSMTEMMHEIKQDSTIIDEAYLYHLYHTTQKFYKTNLN